MLSVPGSVLPLAPGWSLRIWKSGDALPPHARESGRRLISLGGEGPEGGRLARRARLRLAAAKPAVRRRPRYEGPSVNRRIGGATMLKAGRGWAVGLYAPLLASRQPAQTGPCRLIRARQRSSRRIGATRVPSSCRPELWPACRSDALRLVPAGSSPCMVGRWRLGLIGSLAMSVS